MSDRDGYWDSDWDPEVGVDPPDESDSPFEPTAEEVMLEHENWLCKYRYEVHRKGSGKTDVVLMAGGQWGPLSSDMSGKFQTEHKWLADIVAEKLDGEVVEAERELTDDELQENAWAKSESVEDL